MCIDGYVEKLNEALQEIRDRIQTCSEQENVKVRQRRHPPVLPEVEAAGGDLRPCRLHLGLCSACSLELLIGRDVLDGLGLGGVLDVGERTLRCRLFESLAASLEQLSAGTWLFT